MMNETNWDGMRLLELAAQGYYCGQILMILALEERGEENRALVQTMGSLSGGLGFTGKNCGALTGGACLLAYLAPSEADGVLSGEAQVLITEFVRWFEETIGTPFGGIDCDTILAGDYEPFRVCSSIIRQVYEKCQALLAEQAVGQ